MRIVSYEVNIYIYKIVLINMLLIRLFRIGVLVLLFCHYSEGISNDVSYTSPDDFRLTYDFKPLGVDNMIVS